jgi:serine phosphatase RsbU (regulator of sigma subunit)
LAEVAMRCRQSPPQATAGAMLKSAEEWGASAEQADDMTVVVARFTGPAKPSTA